MLRPLTDRDTNMKLIHGDCFNIIPDLKDKINLIVTDPPYWHTKSHRAKNQRERGYHIDSKSKFANSGLFRDGSELMNNFSDFNPAIAKKFLDIASERMQKIQIIAFCNETILPHYMLWAEEQKLKTNILVWEKPISVINSNRFSMNAEFIVRIYDSGCPLNKIEHTELYGRVKHDKPVKSKMHPTEKPIDLIEGLIRLLTKKGELILDPFMGSGSTGVACINTGRKFIGIEKEEKYFEIAKNRIESHHKNDIKTNKFFI